MEFKVFKNENSKILKEYWLTQSEWDSLDKATVQEGDIYHIVGTIDKGDLSADVNASLAKGDSSLQKPTATLAKESFVKVGIDGTQKFDESSYVVAPSADGTAGQVLKKTATGTEWANESGGADTLEAKLNENIIKNPDKTYLVWKGNQFPDGEGASFKAPAGCTIDWGDGNVETFEVASTAVNTHTYTDGIGYHLISLSNYRNIEEASFSTCNGLINIIISNYVTNIGKNAFGNCWELTSVTIGDGVTSIGVGAFQICEKLTSVIIGSSVTSIGSAAFGNCTGLETIKMSSITVPTIGTKTFDMVEGKIIVPKSAIDSYKTASGWSTYVDKIVYEVDSSDLNSGGGGKTYYRHSIRMAVPQAEIYVKDATGAAATVYSDGDIYVTFINQNSEKITTKADVYSNISTEYYPATFYSVGPADGEYVGSVALNGVTLGTDYYIKIYGAVTSVSGKPFAIATTNITTINDFVSEL